MAMNLTIGEKVYRIKYGYNSFCDTDLMERVQSIAALFSDNGVESDAEVSGMGKIKDLFVLVRELIFVGFQKFNPVDSVEEVGDLLDQYREEAQEGEDRGLVSLFVMLSEELSNEGFLSDLMANVANAQSRQKKKR